MRLDKFLAEAGLGSRKEVKQLIKKGQITVNQQIEKSDKKQVDPEKDRIEYRGELLHYQEFYYYVLHKPAGVVSATEDQRDQTVMDLFSAKDYRSDLFPVGRLDKDTEGLLLITNDGKLAHELLSPKKHVEKEYFAEVSGVMTDEDQQKFTEGIFLDGERTLPAELSIDEVTGETSKVRIILHEGKFHQVKRMVKSCGKEVTYLKRIRMGGLTLPQDLAKGKYRLLTEDELRRLKG
ncbi:pseudouridine synthase [Enterococcus hulanensis]|uniref:Pseudouridine synthase n=1 Tax=Enterococcus hulanensis TaxID=2559929 RepID=A0ABU3EW36_9ENTE|nr:pseudouridine synthase [Enterococcus hulanensis]MDT2599084.1 pseudouridine synthase [Enterococcus hulanensis]MDT2608491.1 pseudouridine synthase [Enterococcus hulanensis]MDT2616246.1 pseudouridine synthase [Enterococcus hulanensis]MDT2627714.1 pseudouridine synthase [Enterococcus hulanensis]MDT2655744.1 pseudouridine synthase [Enterococcus hulanensis]